MFSSIKKITLNNNDSFLDIYQSETGLLVFETGSSHPLSPIGCCRFETDSRELIELLQKLVSK